MKAWISKLLSEGDGSPSVKRVLFVLAVLCALSLAVGYFLAERKLDDKLIELIKHLVTVTGTAYGVGRFAEVQENKPPAT